MKNKFCLLSVLFLLILCLLLSFTACSSGNVTLDPDADNDDLIYNDVRYMKTEWDFYTWMPDDEQVELGRHFNLPFSMYLVYYSYTAEDPLYIVSGNLPYIYLREGFVVEDQVFKVEGTDRTIKLSEAFLPADPSITSDDLDTHTSKGIDLRMVDCPTLRIYNSVILLDGNWYMEKDPFGETVLRLSDEMVSILIEAGMLTEQPVE